MATKLFILADSISIQYKPYLIRYLPTKVKVRSKTGAEEFLAGDMFVRKDENGGNSEMVKRYLELGQKEIEADILLLNTGLHDIRIEKYGDKIEVPAVDYKSNLEEILKLAKKITDKVVWITTIPINQDQHNNLNVEYDRYEVDLEKYNEIAENIMKKKKIPLIDLNELMSNFNIIETLEDHVHFKTEYRKVQAAYIAGWLQAFMSK